MPTRASRGKTEFCGPCFDCRRKGGRETISHNRVPGDTSTYVVSSKKYTMYLATARETANSSAWNHIFYFQRRGPPRRRARKLLSLCHSRECTKDALPNYNSKGKFGAKAELRNILQEKLRGKGGSSCRFDCLQKQKNVGTATRLL